VKRLNKGKFDKTKAIGGLYRNVVNPAVLAYKKEFGSFPVSPATKRGVAKARLRYIMGEWRAGNY
jgi:hypothetical protein